MNRLIGVSNNHLSNNPVVNGNTYTWGNGTLRFDSENTITTTWANGTCKWIDALNVEVSWSIYSHLMKFDLTYNSYTAVRKGDLITGSGELIPIDLINMINTIYDLNIPLENRLSLLSKQRLFNVFFQCLKFKGSGYSFIECGVAKGGALSLMKYVSLNEPVFGFDSFEGMPDITKEDLGNYNKTSPLTDYGKVGDNLSGGIETVYSTFKTLGVSVDNVHLVKGFYENTLSLNKNKCGKIAVLRVDCDWYASVKICLEEFYDQVIDGGVIIIDDYGHFIGAKLATDEFRTAHNITSPLIQTDYTEFYWYK